MRLAWALVCLALTPVAAATTSGYPELAHNDRAVGRFEQRRYVPALQDPVVSRGRFTYHADLGVIWQVEEPVASRLVLKPSGAYQDGEAVAAGPILAVIEALFRGVFEGNFDPLEQRFEVTRTGPDQGWRLELVPRSRTLARAIDRVILAGDQQPRRVEIRGADGSRTELVFSAIRHPERLSESARRALQRER